MPLAPFRRPEPEEVPPYYVPYLALVPEGDLLSHLQGRLEVTPRFTGSISEERGVFRYAPGKWSAKEVFGHVIDIERVFAYRALRIARGDTTALPGFDEQLFVPAGGFDARTWADLADEYVQVRRATLSLFERLDEAAQSRRGTANGLSVTPRVIAYIVAGHELHHLEVIRTRYL
jgi:hypothetical protein